MSTNKVANNKGYILVVVESPGKVKKIQEILGPSYLVMASFGHIIDLKPKEMSVDLKTFTPTYVSSEKSTKIIQELKSKYKNSSKILLASDEDREGEMIAWSIAHVLDLQDKDIHRIVFNSITKDAILNAVKNPRKLDYNLIDAQKARRILDRIVGFELSPILWAQLKQYDLSAGRVQSVVVKIIVEKEEEIKKFLQEDEQSFFKFKATFNINSIMLISNLHDLKSTTTTNTLFRGPLSSIPTLVEAKNFMTRCIQSSFKVANITDKKRISNPSAPFTTSTLQQESFRKLGFNVQRTMVVAQKLYEAGYITYMRTDSSILSPEAVTSIKNFITSNYTEEYYMGQVYGSKKNNTQEAHEAVRPTKIEVEQLEDSKDDEKKLYNLIWKRTVASQMKPAEYNDTQIQLSISKTDKYFFETTISKLVFAGYLKVYDIKNLEVVVGDEEENTLVATSSKIPKLNTQVDITQVESLIGKQEYLKPPSRYNEGSLTKKLDPDNLNIGRPGTTAGIITKIQQRGYVTIMDMPGIEKDAIILELDKTKKKIKETGEKITIGKENNKFIPLTMGQVVNDLLESNFPKILDYKFTEDLENSLDKIAEGNINFVTVLKKFYKEFHSLVEKFKDRPNLIEDKYTRVVGKYLDTGCDIVATLGKFGPFIKLVNPDKKKRGDGKEESKEEKADNKVKNTLCKEKSPAPIKPPLTIDSITLKQSLELLKFPINLGVYKENQVLVKTGKFGYYISYDDINISLNEVVENLSKFTLKDAIKLIDAKQSNILKELVDEDNKKKYVILEGPHGKYINVKDIVNTKSKSKIKKKRLNVALPKDTDYKKLTLVSIQEIITKSFEKKKTRWQKKGVTKEDTKEATKVATRVATKKK